jgi:hypothetical protein
MQEGYMTQSFKKALATIGISIWAAILIGISYLGLFLVPYHELLRMKPYTGTILKAMQTEGYPALFPLYVIIALFGFYFATRKDKNMWPGAISMVIIFGAGMFSPLMASITASHFLSRQIVYTGSCSDIRTEVVDQGTNSHVVLTFMCANGKSYQDGTPDMIALVIDHPRQDLICNVSAENKLDCGQSIK